MYTYIFRSVFKYLLTMYYYYRCIWFQSDMVSAFSDILTLLVLPLFCYPLSVVTTICLQYNSCSEIVSKTLERN